VVKEKVIKIFAYELSTPKFNYEKQHLQEGRYDHAHFEKLLSAIIELNTQNRPLHLDGKFITLEYYKNSDDTDIIEGAFTSAKYGQIPDWVHSRTLRRRKSGKDIEEGEESRTHFIIDKKTGLFLLQSDTERIVSRNSIDKYFRHHSTLINDFIKEYNIENTNKFEIYPKMFYRLVTVISDDFYKDIDKLSRIKKGTLEVDVNQDINNDALNAIKKQSAKIGNVENVGYVVHVKTRGRGLTNVKEFFKQIEELNRYSDIIVEGSSALGIHKKVNLVDHPYKYEIKIPVNSNGIPNNVKLIEHMVYLSKHENPLRR